MRGQHTIVVMGATGAQGGGLVRAALADPERPFVVRAVTRNASAPAAKELTALGAEVVEADLDDEASVARAVQGADLAYFVTFYWHHMSVEREQQHAMAMARAAAMAELKHVVWSTLPDTRLSVPLDDDRMPTLDGRYKVPHFDGKGAADRFFSELGVPTTFLQTTFYFDDFITLFPLLRDEHGVLTLNLPLGERRLAGIAAEDIGQVALGVLRRPDLIGSTVAIAGESLTGEHYAATMTRVLGERVAYRPLSFEQFRSQDFPGAADLGNMFQYYHDFEESFVGARDLHVVRSLHPGLQDFETWLRRHKNEIPV